MKGLLIVGFLIISIFVNSQERYDSKIEIKEGVYLVSQNRKFGIIDSFDNIILPIIYEEIEFDGNLGLTRKLGLLGLIDMNGKVIIPNEYESIEVDGNRAKVTINGKQKIITFNINNR